MKDLRIWAGAYPNVSAPRDQWRGTELTVRRLADHLDDTGAFSVALDITPEGVKTYASRVLVCCEDSQPFEYLGADVRILWVQHGNPDTTCIDMADIVVFSSNAHMRDVRSRHKDIDPDKCVVIGLPCAGADGPLKGIKKKPFRVLYGSAPERGLHHCLRIFGLLKTMVPEAELHVTYGVDYFLQHKYQATSLGVAAVEVQDLLETTEGVRLLNGISYEEMQKEMAEATLLLYPCDPIAFSENFCISIGEAVLADTIPLASTADALHETWGATGMLLPLPVKHDEWAKMAAYVLRNRRARQKIRKELKEIAPALTLDFVTQRWVSLISSLQSA